MTGVGSGYDGGGEMTAIDHDIVRAALAQELRARGLPVAGDTVGLRGVLYVEADGDGAAALFEFKHTADPSRPSTTKG